MAPTMDPIRFGRPLRSSTSPGVRYELDELIDAGEDVVASVTGYFRGRDGMEERTRTAFVWTIRDGAIAHIST